ncbi:MAG TPA: hypothetical protein VFS29_11690 [Motilibacteraceae bacterium]|nr:hypothetical protein [Motilibacteraceae bacterium]
MSVHETAQPGTAQTPRPGTARPRVVVLMASRYAYHKSVRLVRERLGPDVQLEIVSWQRSDFPLTDVCDAHLVVAPPLRTLPTSISQLSPTEAMDEASEEAAEAGAAGPDGLAGAPVALSDDAPFPASDAAAGESAALVDENGGGAENGDSGMEQAAAARSARLTPRRVAGRVKRALRPRGMVRRVRRSRGGKLARRVVKGSLARQFAKACLRGPKARGVLASADVVIALDYASIRAAWHIARRVNRSAPVVYGLDAGARALQELGQEG